MRRNRTHTSVLTALSIAGAFALSACAPAPSGVSESPAAAPAADGIVVVTTTTWQAAFAKAAGADEIITIAPTSSQHAARSRVRADSE